MITITKVIAVLVFLTGVLGLFLGDRSLAGAINIDLAEDITHLLTSILLWIAAAKWDTPPSRGIFWTLGIIYLIVGIAGFISPTLYGLLPSGLALGDNLIHIVVGLLMMYFGYKQNRVHR
jgi:hypothetical protein